MVHRVLEGLRDEAFELARDIGVESLTAPGGFRSLWRKCERSYSLVARRKKHVSSSGLARNMAYSPGKQLLRTLDTTIELSEPMRVELLLEPSGLTRQEALILRTSTRCPECWWTTIPGSTFARAKPFGGSSAAPRSTFRYTGKGSKSKGKSKKNYPPRLSCSGGRRQKR